MIDVRVVDTDAESYCRRSVRQVIRSAEDEKKAKYSAAVEERRGSFTPFVVSVDGYMGDEADRTLRRLAEVLAGKWDKRYSSVIDWVRAYIHFPIIRASNLCLRGQGQNGEVQVDRQGFEDGGVLPLLKITNFIILNHISLIRIILFN